MQSYFRLAAGPEKEDTVKTFALAATLALIVCGAAQAGVTEFTGGRGPAAAAPPPGGTVLLQAVTSELAEPEMLAMMVVGLVLIGYRATRDSSDKFQ